MANIYGNYFWSIFDIMYSTLNLHAYTINKLSKTSD